MDKRNLLALPVAQKDEQIHQKEPRTESTPVPQEKEPQTESTPPIAEIHASNFQPTPHDPSISDKYKAPTTEDSEADDEETEDELDPFQFRLARRRLGSFKIII